MARTPLVCSLLLAALAAPAAHAKAVIPIGAKPKTVTLSEDAGGKVDGTPWSSESIKDKVWLLFYVDPDEEGANPDLEKALKAANFDRAKYGSIAVINMGATWKPNAIIAQVLKSKQEDYPDTVYVKDMDKALVKEWKLTDDQYDVVLFDRGGKVLFAQDGTFSKADADTLIALINKEIAK